MLKIVLNRYLFIFSSVTVRLFPFFLFLFFLLIYLCPCLFLFPAFSLLFFSFLVIFPSSHPLYSFQLLHFIHPFSFNVFNFTIFFSRLDHLKSQQNAQMDRELRKNEEVKKEIEKNRVNILYRQELQDRKTDLRRQKEVRVL